MTYNDIVTPIRKTLFGEADIIYTILTAHHGRVEAIAKGIRKSASRKRGNIELGVFSSLHFAKGKNLDIILEAQMLEYNHDLLEPAGVKFLYEILPTVNKFSTDHEHSTRIFELLKEVFLGYETKYNLKYLVLAKYSLLDIQNVLPDWSICSSCRLKFDELNKISQTSHSLICNNCARKLPSEPLKNVKNTQDIENMSDLELLSLNKLLSHQIKSL